MLLVLLMPCCGRDRLLLKSSTVLIMRIRNKECLCRFHSRPAAVKAERDSLKSDRKVLQAPFVDRRCSASPHAQRHRYIVALIATEDKEIWRRRNWLLFLRARWSRFLLVCCPMRQLEHVLPGEWLFRNHDGLCRRKSVCLGRA